MLVPLICGPQPEQYSRSAYTENGRHIGLYNVNKRITLVYGEAYGVEIESEYGKGTTITLKLPLVKDEALFKNEEAGEFR